MREYRIDGHRTLPIKAREASRFYWRGGGSSSAKWSQD